MEIESSLEGTRAIIKISGKVIVSSVSALDDVAAQYANVASDYDLDFADVDYISSAGLRTIIAMWKRARERGGTVSVINPNESVLEILEMTGLAGMVSVITS